MDYHTDGNHAGYKQDAMNASRGQTLPLVAMSVLVLVGMAGFAVDVGYHQYQQRRQQTATDSAALAGAAELQLNDWQAAARQDASNNGFTDNTGQSTCPASPAVGTVCVVVNSPPVSPDAYAGNAQAVEVQITAYHPTFLESAFGINNVPVSTKAVAYLTPESSNNCLYVLNGQANFNGQNTPGATINAPNCGLQFNQAANFHSATVNAAAINCAASCGGGTFVNAQPQNAAPASDPCGFISYCAHLASNPPPCSQFPAVSVTNNQPVTLQPGCYNGTNGSDFNKLKNASSVTFTCGLYVINGVTLSISATGTNATPIPVNETCPAGTPGETFYVENGGSIVMNNDIITLNAPTSGDYTAYTAGEQNVLIYNAGTGNITMQSASCQTGCNSLFSGMLYTPNSTLNYNQYSTTNTGAVLIIVGTLNANGGINNIIGPGGRGPYTISVPTLGE
jgi:hypothetical protein